MNLVGLGVGKSPDCKREDRSAAAHQIPRGNGDVAAAADNDHATHLREHFQIAAKIHVGQHFQNDVHAAAGGAFFYFVLAIGFRMIERLMRALTLYELQSLCRACGTENRQAERPCDLYGGDPDTATGPVNKNSLATACFRLMMNRVVCGAIRDIDASALGKGDSIGQRLHL